MVGNVDTTHAKYYVASRASIPERGSMWRRFRSKGVEITSSWIDEDGEGQTEGNYIFNSLRSH